jgi:hypothetical protein
MNSLFPSMRVLALAFLFVTGSAWADYTTTLNALSVTNHTGYVIDADAAKIGAPARSVIAGSVTLKYTRSGGVIGLPDGVDYTLRWSLVNAAGVAQPLDTGGDFVETTQPVSWTGGVTEVTLTSTVNLNPAARLAFTDQYRLRVVATPAFGGTAATYTEAAEKLYGHFTNTVSPDAPLNVIGIPAYAEIDRTWVITSPEVPGPTLMGTLFMARYDDFNEAAVTANIPVRLRAVMKDVSNPMAPVDVPLTTPSADHLQPLLNHTNIGDNPATATPTFELVLLPQNLNRAATYQTTAIFEYQEANGDFISLGEIATAPQSIFPVTGKLMFGDVETRFTELTGVPTETPEGRWILSIPAGKGHLKDRPGLTFGGQFVVSLDAAGNATLHETSDEATVNGIDTEKIAGVRYKRELITLSHLGAYATKLTVYFPAGFTVSVPAQGASVPEKNASGKAVLHGVTLIGGAALLPPNTLTLTPPSVRRGVYPSAVTAHSEFFCHHEKLPTWFKASAISLNTTTGAFNLVGLGEWRFVRDTEMTLVEALHQPATDPPLHEKDTRPSNDSHFRNAHLANAMESKIMSIQADAHGVAVLSAQVPLGGGQARPHYPQGTGAEALEGIAFTSGVLQITNNAVVAEGSLLSGVTQVRQRYARDPRGKAQCPPGSDQKAGAGEFVLRPVGDVLRFTPELGLIGTGSLTAAPLEWGTVGKDGATYHFAQRVVTPFTTGTFYQPGLLFPGTTATSLGNDYRISVLLLSGREKPGGTPEDLAYMEKPNTAAYQDAGLANYAGLNLRVGEEPPGMEGKSRIDGKDFGPYPLKTRGKYYVQLFGVTGMHERATSPAPAEVTFYDFPVQLDDYKLSYLDNKPEKSLCKGRVDIPFPVGIQQGFAELLFNESGQPTSARMPAGPQVHNPGLAYWSGVPFTAHSIGFRPQKSSEPCVALNPDKGLIEMGVTFSNMAGGTLPGTISAVLGYKAVKLDETLRGELITLDDSKPGGVAWDTGIDSRLHLPPNLKFVVPGGGEYTLNPVTRGCFSSSAGATVGSPSGFLSFAGTLAVPFFKEMPVHVHLGLQTLNSPVHIMGGWSEGGQTFFSDPGRFDPQHLGYPQALAVPPEQKLTTYRDLPEDVGFDIYRPRAQKCWMDIVDFDFPLKWSPTSKRFTSIRTKKDDLLLFDIDQKLEALSGSGAEIKFGAEIPRLPQFNPQRLVMDVADGISGGAFSNFSTALADASVGALDATGLTRSITALSDLMSDRVDTVFETALGAAVDVLLVNALAAAESSAAAQVAGGVEAQRNAFVSTLKSQLKILTNVQAALHSAIGQASEVPAEANGLMKEVTAKLKDAREGVKLLRKIIARDPEPEGPRQIFRNLTSELAKSEEDNLIIEGVNYLSKALDNLEEVHEFTENPFFEDLDGVLEQTETQLDDLIAAVNTQLGDHLKVIASQLLTAQPENSPLNFLKQLEAKIDEVANRILPPFTSTLRDVAGPAPGQFRAPHLRLALRRAILDKIQGAVLGEKVQSFLKDSVGLIRDTIRDSTDKLLAQVTTTVKEAFHEQVAAGVGNANNPLNGLDNSLPIKQFGDVFQGASLRGYARTVGNSISALRLDGSIKISPPGMGTGMEFAGYFYFRDNHLEGPRPEGCLAVGGEAADKACQVEAGASFGSKSRPNKTSDGKKGTSILDDLNVSLDVKFAFKDGGLLGVTGRQNFKGKIDLGLITLREIDMKLNFSSANQYLLAYANGEVAKVLGVDLWIFAGRSCNLAAMKTGKNPDVFLLDRYTNHTLAKVAGLPPTDVAGVLMKTIGTISLNDLLRELAEVDIPKEVLEVSFSRGYTYFYGLSLGQLGQPAPVFMAAMSMFGDMKAELLGVSIASVEGGISGAVGLPVNNWVNDSPPPAMTLLGRAEFSAVEGLLEASLEVGGTLSRDDVDIYVNDFDVLDLP